MPSTAITIPPVLIFFASFFSYTLTAAYTSRDSPIRYAALAFLALCAYLFPPALESFSHTTGPLARIASGAVCWNVFVFFDKMLVKRWDYYHYGPITQPHEQAQKNGHPQSRGKKFLDESQPHDDKALHYPGTRMDFSSEVTSCARAIGLFWQVNHVPLFSRLQPEFVPSRAAFVLVHATTLLLVYPLHIVLTTALGASPRHYQTNAYVPFVTRLEQVSLEEVRVRVLVTLEFWALQWCIMQLFFSLFALLSALGNPDEIRLWRPLFGSPRDSYTMRNFWGKFWHQNLRSGLSGLSDFVAHDVLRLPPTGLLQRYTKIMCSFVLSGTMHVVSDMGCGLRASQSGALVFFPMQACGIVAEDVVHAIYRRFVRRDPGTGTTTVERAVGYAWVVLFLVWTSPVWLFPMQLQVRTGDCFIDFAAFKTLIFGSKG